MKRVIAIDTSLKTTYEIFELVQSSNPLMDLNNNNNKIGGKR